MVSALADRRATTPTAAAEMILPSKDEVVERVVVLKRRLQRATDNGLQRRRENLRHWTHRLADPSRGLRQGQVRLDDLSLRLWRRQEDSNARLRERLGHLAGRLESVNPLAVLRRGYSIVYRVSDGSIVKDVSALRKGHRVRLDFATGRAVCQVEEVEE